MIEDDSSFSAEVFSGIAAQLRSALGNLHFAAAALAPAEAREQDPDLDGKAALLDQSYYRILRLASNLSLAAYVDRGTPFPVRDRDLVELVRESCEQSRSLAELLGLRLSFTCPETSHVCAVFYNSIEQLLLQLLSNAFKFTPAGGSVTVELRFADGRALLSVTDTGCGIPEELLSTLFERYRHAEPMTPPPHGLGLGLLLCRRIAECHGGSLVAESRVGKGTRITLSIPDRQTGVAGVSDVPVDYTGGFNPTLLSLADALPAKAFALRNQE
jgi:signal transduction histidine kinase